MSYTLARWTSPITREAYRDIDFDVVLSEDLSGVERVEVLTCEANLTRLLHELKHTYALIDFEAYCICVYDYWRNVGRGDG